MLQKKNVLIEQSELSLDNCLKKIEALSKVMTMYERELEAFRNLF